MIDIQEEKLMKDIENGVFVQTSNFSKRKQFLENSFQYTIQKRKPINIRLLESDIHRIKVMAVEEGLPYQTLISKVLHQFSTGKIILK